MVDLVHTGPSVQPQDEVDLTDDQIQQLLLEAEGRLRGPVVSNSQDLDAASLRIPKLSSGTALEPYVRQGDEIATVDSAQLIDPKQKVLSNSIRPLDVNNPKKEKPTAGPDWFNLPKTELTTELKRDLQLIRMRSVLDPKRHYKKENGKAKPPDFSQVGTIIQGPTEFFSGRIAKKDRKKTFVEETMALERETRRFESKYRDIQSTKQSGKKAFYNNLRSKRNRKMK
ncbi:Fcf2 pre-rRNA processing [Penicillium atrosanguineum]|uniref:Fcf2 pre-rRNA processing n=1 Tax=Penicillium atrosanguineum TaxID=1132637 RepID=A0A9W9UC19_9EURO|nr:Salicylate hydroxylase [Penicillium atrosanguineum]KAJ5127528.1 Fcf2 pre-rRNA processing [Penicillium atrosanguineum]KAJ5147733.1 Fcf2 pre-rRNA processing [Penicillium atrosanguineum]KAJ5313793.1 Salicylate hydroxylase [Penicillium atrosanguineum]KAJ5330966.1 Fcf2 pre-rRNA processing [Penicillium atrosanguineum]